MLLPLATQASPPAADARSRSAAQLIEDLRAKDEAVSFAAHRRLVEMGADAVPALVQSLAGDTEVYALLILGRIGPRAEAALPELRRRLEAQDRRRWLYAVTITRIKPGGAADMVPHLAAGLDQGGAAAAESANALARLDTAEARQALLARLRGPDRKVRHVAAHALSETKEPDAVAVLPVLLESLAEAATDAEREQGVLYIANLGRDARPALEALVAQYERGARDLRRASAVAIAWAAPVAGVRVLPALLEGLDDPRPAARRRSASAIAQLGEPARAHRPAIERLLKDPVTSVQEAAQAADNALRSTRAYTQPLDSLRLKAIGRSDAGWRAFFLTGTKVVDAEAGAWLHDGRVQAIEPETVVVAQDVVDERLRLTQRTVRVALFPPGARPLPAQPTKGTVAPPISLALAGDDLREVVTVFAMASGLNLVLQHTAHCAPLTVAMRGWPWDAAMEHILKVCGLEYAVEGTFVRVAAKADFKRYPFVKQQFTGHPIKMEFLRARAPDLWKLFEEISDLKVEPHPEGESTMHCDECPWDEVFAALARSQGFEYETQGAVIRLKRLP